MRTDLYHDHSEPKDVRFLRSRTTSLQNLWRGPCSRISLILCCRVHPTNNRRKPEISQASVAVGANDNSGLAKGYRWGPNRPNENIYPIQISVYGVVRVKILETFSYIQQLDKITLSVKCDYRERLTRPIRFVPGFSLRNSVRVPFDIHSETICKGSVVTPTKGTMFGCLNCFHITAASKNDYKAHRCS